MCNTLLFIFMCIKNTLISVHGLKNEVYSCVTSLFSYSCVLKTRLFRLRSWIIERGIFMCNACFQVILSSRPLVPYDSFNSTTFRCGPLSELIN